MSLSRRAATSRRGNGFTCHGPRTVGNEPWPQSHPHPQRRPRPRPQPRPQPQPRPRPRPRPRKMVPLSEFRCRSAEVPKYRRIFSEGTLPAPRHPSHRGDGVTGAAGAVGPTRVTGRAERPEHLERPERPDHPRGHEQPEQPEQPEHRERPERIVRSTAATPIDARLGSARKRRSLVAPRVGVFGADQARPPSYARRCRTPAT